MSCIKFCMERAKIFDVDERWVQTMCGVSKADVQSRGLGRARPEPSRAQSDGPASGFGKPKPSKAGPKPGLSGRAGPCTSLHSVAQRGCNLQQGGLQIFS